MVKAVAGNNFVLSHVKSMESNAGCARQKQILSKKYKYYSFQVTKYKEVEF
jgi:hypothetical protein